MDADAILLELLRHPSHLPEGKESIIRWAGEHLAALGFSVSVFSQGCDPVLVARYGEPALYFNGHLDVVPPGSGWTRKDGETDGDVIYGRGTLDMKGPCAALLSAAGTLAGSGVPVGVILTTDEETTMNGARTVAERWEWGVPEFLLVCEPTNFRVMSQEKGALHFTVKARGRSAHGSMPEKGINALDALLEIYLAVRERVKGMDGVTVNLGTMHGGEKVNMVARDATMELDVRFPPTFCREGLERDLLSPLPRNGAEAEFFVNQYLEPWRAVESRGLELLREMSHGDDYGAPYATEAVVFKKLCPCAVFGPGDPDGAHEADESIRLSDVARAESMYVSFARDFLEG